MTTSGRRAAPGWPPIEAGSDVAIAVDLRRAICRWHTALVMFSSGTGLLSAGKDSPAAPDARRSGLLARSQQPRLPGRIARDDPAGLATAQDEPRAARAGRGPSGPRCPS